MTLCIVLIGYVALYPFYSRNLAEGNQGNESLDYMRLKIDKNINGCRDYVAYLLLEAGNYIKQLVE